MESSQIAGAGSRAVGWKIAPEGGDTGMPLNLGKRLALIEALLPPLPGLRLLDAGCGGGEYLRALVDRGADAVGIECVAEKLEAARRHPLEVARRIRCGDVQATEFDTGCFDAVLLNEVLEHVPDDVAALREVHRILRPGGSLLLFSPNRLHPFETHGVFARHSGRRVSHATPFVPWVPLPIGRRIFRYWARNYWPWELSAMLRRAGFSVERRGFVWPTFENISGHQPSWMRRGRPLLRGASALGERVPGLRALGVSQWILATRRGEGRRTSPSHQVAAAPRSTS